MRRGHLTSVPAGIEPDDQVARFESLKADYPQASYSAGRSCFYGALRDDDTVLRRVLLKDLIDALLARETG